MFNPFLILPSDTKSNCGFDLSTTFDSAQYGYSRFLGSTIAIIATNYYFSFFATFFGAEKILRESFMELVHRRSSFNELCFRKVHNRIAAISYARKKQPCITQQMGCYHRRYHAKKN